MTSEITDTRGRPWRWICHLICHHKGPHAYPGTGWLAGPRLVVTAGHMIFNPMIDSDHASITEIEVFPGGITKPYGSCTVKADGHSILYDAKWGPRSWLAFYDIGYIILPENYPIGKDGEHFTFPEIPDALGITANLAGYPQEPNKTLGTLWHGTGSVIAQIEKILHHNIKAMWGDSGAPVYVIRDGQYDVIATHTQKLQGATSYQAVRLRPELVNDINLLNAQNP